MPEVQLGRTQRIDRKNAKISLLDSVKTIIFDCDGVLWRGKTLLPQVQATLTSLRERGKQVLFLTNNSGRGRHALQTKFSCLGLSVALEEVMSSAYLVAAYVRESLGPLQLDEWIYVVGREGIVEELSLAGYRSFGIDDDHKDYDFELPLPDAEKKVRAVIVGFDHHFNYTKLAKARHYLSSYPECLFLATNMDSSYPDVHHILPGTGSIVSAIQVAAGKEPKVIGKPNTLAFEAIHAIHPEVDACATLMVGDKLQTDVAFGLACGMRTLLVESGVHSESEAKQLPLSDQPHFVATSIAELLIE